MDDHVIAYRLTPEADAARELALTFDAERLRAASRTDASVNAIILLDTYAKAVPMVIDADLEELRPLFAPYLSPAEPGTPAPA